MLDRSGREKIKRLRSEIQHCKSALVIGDRWKPLYRECCSLLADLYGIRSREIEGFNAIRFEIQRPLHQAEETLRTILSPSNPPPAVSLESYYRERLSEADEYLLSLLLSD